MTLRLRAVRAMAGALALTLAIISTPAWAAVQFWFGGVDPVVQKDRNVDQPADFMSLFTPDAPWRAGAAHLKVFMISTQFATRASDADLAALVTDLRRRGIGLALEAGMLRNDRGCGKGEGYMPQGLLERGLLRIKQAGGTLAYLTMDEVVFFGHERNWSDKLGPACQDSLEEIADEVAAKVPAIHAIFPEAQIGAVEPVTTGHGLNVVKLVGDYAAFADLYRAKTGSRLAFWHADIAWRTPGWRAAIAPLKAIATQRGVRFGVIFGGTPDQTDDVSWTRFGLDQLKAFTANQALAPDDVVVQTWQPRPTRTLPETEPGAHTWMLLQAEQSLAARAAQ